jgi:hypothetical protein
MFGNETSYRWVYEGVIDDPYGEVFIAGNKSLQKVFFTFTIMMPSIGGNVTSSRMEFPDFLQIFLGQF